ncbi:hypothetical protein I302_107665 [Kwoniella bestiolae CBS 10118]|uniref:Origin recognition complex subunit 1 n=1 Tax=Kwoniella bestiolae CBS 10118 TaxID=1296100 RepID=A0A1B9FXV8_9TREE|nr:origin recognition complex subunit 1 [Kwoniella bestiolae CBS 10118]OCF23613.1 origin recognition complex subunit 1 [Kwoniella bestiolae CBS 10118]
MTIPASSTPRRSTRGTIFTPSPSATPSLKQANTTYTWTSAPLPSSSSSSSHPDEAGKVRYNSYSRIISRVGSTPLKIGGPSSKKIKAGKGDEESRFTVGDGVLVSVEGGDEGVGILIGLWEEPSSPNNDDDGGQEEEDGEDEEEEDGPKMMAEIHWAFRKVDLPGVMKNVNVEENEVLLAASLTSRPVTSILPLPYLLRTIPIYSKAFYRDQFPETKSKVKGWSYIRQGVYWCHRAFDKFAKGGKNWRVDIDLWREGGKKTGIWDVPVLDQRMKDDTDEEDEEESGDDEGSEVEGETVEGESDEEEEDEAEEEEEEEGFIPGKRKRSRPGVLKPRKKQKKNKRKIMNLPRRKTKPHPKSLTKNNLPSSIESLENLPVDPYERALRLLHVGSTPESLPCREEEFLDVLGKVEDGVESGGGGCLYIAGVPGTGKTATVHAVVKELKRKAEDGELQPFSYVEINGLKIPSPQHAYTVLWEAISGSKGSSTKTALRGLENHFGRKGGQGVRGPRGHTFVVLMDELDQLLTAKQDVVYNFFNWPTMRDSQLFVIAVANRMDLPQHLAAKIKSRIGLQTILFQPYDRAALISIIQSRLIAHPLAPSGDPKVLLPDAIALAATKMAGTNGDARRVLDACRRAVEVALEGGLSSTSSSSNTKTVNGSTAKQTGSSTNGVGVHPHPVTAKEMMSVLQAMSQSPVSKFIGGCSIQQKLMLCSLVRCIRREGIHEISWRNLKGDFDNLSRSFNIFENTSSIALNTEGGLGVEDNILLSNSELNIILSSLLSSHALICGIEVYRSIEERKVALGMEIGETGRVLMNEGESWRRALAGV